MEETIFWGKPLRLSQFLIRYWSTGVDGFRA